MNLITKAVLLDFSSRNTYKQFSAKPFKAFYTFTFENFALLFEIDSKASYVFPEWNEVSFKAFDMLSFNSDLFTPR